MKGICYIVGAGEFAPRGFLPKEGDLVIAADGGYQSLTALGIRPGIVVGDMDSATQSVVGIPLLRFPVRKDDTDLSLALKLGSLAGYRRFRLYGAGGGPREDHFFAAIQLMAGWSRRGMEIRLIASAFTLYAITGGSLIIPTIPGKTISVFSYSPESSGVTLRGLDYEKNNLTLRSDVPLGVSNAAAGRRALISVRRGTLIIWQTV